MTLYPSTNSDLMVDEKSVIHPCILFLLKSLLSKRRPDAVSTLGDKAVM